MPFYPSYDTEGFILGKYVATTKPDAKVAILYQHDDAGKDYVGGFKKGLGPNAAKMVVAEASYEVTDPTVDSQIVTLQASGADTLFNMTTPKFGAQAVRKVYDIGWRPLHLIVSVASSIAGVLEPAGLDKSVGLITAQAFKTPNDPTWAEDKGMAEYFAFMKKYYPEGNPTDASNVLGYTSAELMTRLLERCGDELTRENLMKQVMSMKDEELPLLLPGIKLNTSPTDVNPFHGMRTARFDGKSWVLFGDTIMASDLGK
jgi:ABC-type branched-subunit amino acid transport system substrate-binding protein